MPVITSFGTVTDETESKKRTDPSTGYESEYAKFLAVVGDDVKRATKEPKEKKQKQMVNKVFVIDSAGTALEPLSDTPKCDKPKIVVKEFAHFSG